MSDAPVLDVDTDPEADPDAVGPPITLLGVAAACVLIGAVLLFAGSFVANIAGYVVASLFTIVLVGIYRRVDLARRLAPGYRPVPRVRRVVPVVLVGAFLVAGVHVWAIATEVAS